MRFSIISAGVVLVCWQSRKPVTRFQLWARQQFTHLRPSLLKNLVNQAGSKPR